MQTPLEFVLGQEALADAAVWFFSARGDNADIEAAFNAAFTRGTKTVHVVTSNANAKLLALAGQHAGAQAHVIPVSTERDGFLATHSLVAAALMWLRASDAVSDAPIGHALLPEVRKHVLTRLSREERVHIAWKFRDLKTSDTLILLHDPRLFAAGTLIETSVWEAALCAIQRTDFRNFAHGRHVWLARRPESAFLLSLTGIETRTLWDGLQVLAPNGLRHAGFDYNNCGRFECLIALVEALVFVEAIGRAVDIDPAKPGVGRFGSGMYDDAALLDLSRRLGPAVRMKTAAVAKRDDPRLTATDYYAAEQQFRARLSTARFGGVVLDYDGTLVTTDARFDPPDREMMIQIGRLINAGVGVAISTGRGGSAGEALREAVAQQHHASIAIGYYNGAYVQMLDVDIRKTPPQANADVQSAASWLDRNRRFFTCFNIKNSGVQLTVEHRDLVNTAELVDAISTAFPMLRTVESQHSLDIVPHAACKTVVARLLAHKHSGADILCIGDSGHWRGNDHVLLGEPFGVSVHRVCDRAETCWTLFGPTLTGPAAVARILRALAPDVGGLARLDLSLLETGT
ncbi:MAG: HAD hydrolase family protein [Alphaproteobacteria bacterium]|nr:HAD hydrolase family protein [Alphaproteobacteria bacterium]